MQAIVVKIGGSIVFSSASIDHVVKAIASKYRGSRLFVIVGGGELVEAIRVLHRLRPELDEERLHWKCVELLDSTWEVACTIAPDAIPIRTESELHDALSNSDEAIYLVRVASFYSKLIHARLSPESRPATNWDTTTDALAWLLAMTIKAEQVLLVKSCEVKEDLPLVHASETGIVDREIERLARSTPNISIRFYSLITRAV